MKLLLIALMMIGTYSINAQNVIFNKIEKVLDNKDTFLYRVNTEVAKTGEYLGEIEIQGFSEDDRSVFLDIYKKAKKVGANAYTYLPFDSIDGQVLDFDPAHYKIKLFFVESKNFIDDNNTVYIFASSKKKQKIRFGTDNLILQPRTFIKKKLLPNESYDLSTRKLLGSTIHLSWKELQPGQYFEISSFQVNPNSYGDAGISIKSGDIVKLDESYAQFLTLIYKEVN